MEKTYRIGTVEMLKVKSTGRRLYLTLTKELCECFGIRPGDIVRVEIKEGRRQEDIPDAE